MRRPALTAVLATALLLGATPTFADDVEQAKTLFEQGVSDLEAGRFDKACPAIDRSYRLDPRPGTLFALAECEAQRGRIATAVARYTEYLALYKQFTPKKQADQKDRAETSRAQIAALTPEVPLLTVRLPAGAPEEAVIKHDGEVLPRLSLDTPLAVDPGVNVISIEVPGRAPIEKRVSLSRGARVEITLSLESEPVPVSSASASATASETASVAAPATALLPLQGSTGVGPGAMVGADTRTYRIGALIGGSAGGFALIAGIVTGVLAVDRKNVRDRECDRTPSGYDCATTAGISAGEQLKILGGVSTAAFVLGAAGLATSGVLLLAMPSSKPGAPKLSVELRPAGLAISGAM